MNIEHICATTEPQSSLLSDPSCMRIYVGSVATDSKAAHIVNLVQNAINQENLQARVVRTGSFGCYDLEPIVRVEKPHTDPIFYTNVTPERIADLIDDLSNGRNGAHISELPLFRLQKRIALRNCGWIDPDDINHFICHGQGYSGLANALKMNPPDLLADRIPFALKGRGGPGYASLDKWKIFAKSESVEKYLICNAIDWDPRSLTSRLLLESDPHSVFEGLLISCYAIGATLCLIYIEEGAEAACRLGKALEQMGAYKLLGSNILDSPFCLDIQIQETPVSLISGHRIELSRCAEENQPQPHILPAYPDASKFMGKPVLFTNPETMSSLSAALLDGGADDTAAKVVTLSGSIDHKWTVEVPYGMTIRSIIECFGGVSSGKTLKAVQLGGPSGPFIAPDALDLSVGCDAEEESRSSIGSGAIDVLDADSRMVDLTKQVMAYIQTQSCGKCVFCREGCLQLLTILEDISENRRRPQDLDLLAELGEEMRISCLCEFGRSAPNPVLSSLRLFRGEYEK
jgi:NADH:ubiquinone oxidoreductase subunit F (NADH-binding)